MPNRSAQECMQPPLIVHRVAQQLLQLAQRFGTQKVAHCGCPMT